MINFTKAGLSVEVKEVYKSPEDLSRLIEILGEYKELLAEQQRSQAAQECAELWQERD